jgi:hypothetical protein
VPAVPWTDGLDRPNDGADTQDRANRPDNRDNRPHGLDADDRANPDDGANPDDFGVGLGRQQAGHQTGPKKQTDDRGLCEHGTSPAVGGDEASETTWFRLGTLSTHFGGQRVPLFLKREELRLVCAHL